MNEQTAQSDREIRLGTLEELVDGSHRLSTRVVVLALTRIIANLATTLKLKNLELNVKKRSQTDLVPVNIDMKMLMVP